MKGLILGQINVSGFAGSKMESNDQTDFELTPCSKIDQLD
jgi:hypothetical protein